MDFIPDYAYTIALSPWASPLNSLGTNRGVARQLHTWGSRAMPRAIQDAMVLITVV